MSVLDGALFQKGNYYIENGCRMVWLIYSQKRMVEIYQPDANIDILFEQGSITGRACAAGF